MEAWKFTSAFKLFLRLWVQGVCVRRSPENLQESLPPPSWWALGIELRPVTSPASLCDMKRPVWEIGTYHSCDFGPANFLAVAC